VWVNDGTAQRFDVFLYVLVIFFYSVERDQDTPIANVTEFPRGNLHTVLRMRGNSAVLCENFISLMLHARIAVA